MDRVYSGANEHSGGMTNQQDHDGSDVQHIRRAKPLVSRTRLLMILLLIVAIPVFLNLANKVVHENADAIRQTFNR